MTEPNGLVVPIDSSKPPISNTEKQIYTVLSQRDSALDWQTDSNTKPEVFSPLCSFTAELILRQTASSRSSDTSHRLLASYAEAN